MRSQSILNLILLFSFFITLIFAQEQTHPIDDYLNECLAADSSTASMSNCTTEAYVLWDEELNTVYTNLLATLTPEEWNAKFGPPVRIGPDN